MELFYSKRKENQDGKDFKVLRAKPIMHWIIMLSLVFFATPILYLALTDQSLKPIVNYSIVSGSIFSLLLIIQTIETWSIAFFNPFKIRTIIKKGSVTLSFSSPQELWVEDLTSR